MFSELRGFEEAIVGLAKGPKMLKGIRNNARLEYDDQNLADWLWEKLKAHCPDTIDNAKVVGLNEHFRFYKYINNQRFKRHRDGRFKRNELEESRITFMIYLNHDYKGGETIFDDLTVSPQTGTALCFLHELKHEGRPVIEGAKYVLRSDVMYRKP